MSGGEGQKKEMSIFKRAAMGNWIILVLPIFAGVGVHDQAQAPAVV